MTPKYVEITKSVYQRLFSRCQGWQFYIKNKLDILLVEKWNAWYQNLCF